MVANYYGLYSIILFTTKLIDEGLESHRVARCAANDAHERTLFIKELADGQKGSEKGGCQILN